jgi:hypothetical protein
VWRRLVVFSQQERISKKEVGIQRQRDVADSVYREGRAVVWAANEVGPKVVLLLVRSKPFPAEYLSGRGRLPVQLESRVIFGELKRSPGGEIEIWDCIAAPVYFGRMRKHSPGAIEYKNARCVFAIGSD